MRYILLSADTQPVIYEAPEAVALELRHFADQFREVKVLTKALDCKGRDHCLNVLIFHSLQIGDGRFLRSRISFSLCFCAVLIIKEAGG